MSWFVYILLCEDGSFYTGSTNDLKKRFESHKNGKGGRYTRSHRVVQLIHREEYPTKSASLKREIEIKSWNRARKIQDLRLKINE